MSLTKETDEDMEDMDGQQEYWCQVFCVQRYIHHIVHGCMHRRQIS